MGQLNDETLDAIVAFMDERGYPPSRRELGEALGLTPASVQRRIMVLLREGLIEVDRTTARGIRVNMKAEVERL